MMRKHILFFQLFFSLVFYSGCRTDKPKPVILNGQAQGTYYKILYYEKNAISFALQIDSVLNEFDKTFSVFLPGSIISRINRNDSLVLLNNIFIDLFNRAKEVSDNTEGAFDVTVAPLVKAWGFGPDKNLCPDSSKIDSLKKRVNYKTICIKNNKLIKQHPAVQLDFNAIAQGYAVDLIGEFLESKGIENYMVDIGGEVLAKGKKEDDLSWKAGIEIPSGDKYAERRVESVVPLENMAISTSGNYRNYHEKNGIRYSHTIDPETGFPVSHPLLSVSVMTKKCAVADAYATAFMVTGLEKAKEILNNHKELEAHFIYYDPITRQTKTYTTPKLHSLLLKP